MNHGYVWKHGIKSPVKTEQDVDSLGKNVTKVSIPEGDKYLMADARKTALTLAMSLVDAVNEGLETDITKSELFDALSADATDGIDEDDDSQSYDLVIGAFYVACQALGVDVTTIADMFNDDATIAESAIESAVETMTANMPDEGEDLDNFIESFIFTPPSVEEYDTDYDSLINGKHQTKTMNGKKLHYVGTLAIRHGKKVVVNKRMPGQKARLTQRQKQALKKMRAKALNANFLKKRAKSFKKGMKMGIYNK